MESFKYPCKDCESRHLGCHSSCEKYLKAKTVREEVNHKKFIEHDSFIKPHKPSRTNHSLKTHMKQRVKK